jgi:hypothetical protein
MAEKQPHTQTVRIIHIPDCRMVSSGVGFFGDPNFTLMFEWYQKQTIFPGLYNYDFMSDCCGTGMQWLYIYDERMEVPDGLKIIDFKGGYYAVITAIDGDGASYEGAMAAREEYLKANGLEYDDTRWQIGHVLTGYPLAKELFGAGQMDYWMPIKKVNNS